MVLLATLTKYVQYATRRPISSKILKCVLPLRLKSCTILYFVSQYRIRSGLMVVGCGIYFILHSCGHFIFLYKVIILILFPLK